MHRRIIQARLTEEEFQRFNEKCKRVGRTKDGQIKYLIRVWLSRSDDEMPPLPQSGGSV